MVIVEKKDGSLRLCIDPKELNKSVLRQYKTTPSTEEISSKLCGNKVFTVIDMADCYWHIKLDEPSSELCTFNTPYGRYKFNRMPFCISCASDAAQEMIELNFGDIPNVLAIHDDLIIAAKTDTEHDKIFQQILQRARERNIKFNLKKIQFRVSEVKYLGNIISHEGTRVDPEKTKAISAYPLPTCQADLQRLLGMVNYLRQFIPNMSEITAPLRQLLRKDIHWSWNHEHTSAMEKIKQSIIAEQRYAQIKKELLAIVFACERFNQYTYGRQVSLESDHKPLEYILHKPLSEAPPRIQRLLIRLQKYQVIVKYVPGKDLHIADSLSRAHLNIFDEDDSLNEDCSVMVHTLVQNLPISTDRLKQLEHDTKIDPVLSQITNYITYGWPRNRQMLCGKEKKYWTIRNNLHIAEGIILKENKIVIPTDMRPLILTQLHLSHLGTEKTKARARNVVYCPGLTSDIDKLILNCHKCLKYRNHNKKKKIIQHDIPDLPWSKVGSDIYELHGKIYVIVIDYFSKFIENSVIPDKTAFSVIKFMKTIFTRHGIPSSLIADNNPYNSAEFLNFSKEYGRK
nr:uncharacterized protein K02A2.6-like [Hydra vulgaris]